MFNRVRMKNFGPITQLDWSNPGNINLIIGENGCGKTFILKALYAVIRTIEEYKRGNDQRTANEILVEKLRWTFQIEKIGDLVSKGKEQSLEFNATVLNRDLIFKFGKDTIRQVPYLENHTEPRLQNSLFLPAKEVLSLHKIILKSREDDQLFGFDDTYLDLARALRQSPTKGKNYASFSKAWHSLRDFVGGFTEYEEKAGDWQFKKGNQKYPIGITAEGIKKIGILDILLRNSYLDPGSILFIDEPEAALHPTLISRFLDIIADLSEHIQFFLASHSYFVISKLHLIAKARSLNIPVLSFNDDGWSTSDLKDGMPDNPIIDESIRLYEEEIDMELR